MTTPPCRLAGLPMVPSRRGPRGTALALALLSALALLPALALPVAAQPAATRSAQSSAETASARGSYVEADSIGEVVSRWRPGTHLYVLGDVGLDEDALAELAGWIGDRHWTVVLVADASGETYTDVDGQVRYGEDAVEYGTGQGIPRRRGFAAQVHPRTGEPDGVILTIVLAQRSLFYNAAEALDVRGLGEAAFTGGLDAWAIQAMRERGDLGAAVRETVANVSSRLESAVEQEFQAAESSLAAAAEQVALLERRLAELSKLAPGALRRLSLPEAAGLSAEISSAKRARDAGRAREAAQTLGSVRERIGPAVQALDALARSLGAARVALPAAAEAVTALEQRAAAFRRAHPGIAGPLARPDVAGLRGELAAAEAATGDDPGQAARAAEAVRGRALALVRAIEEYPAAGEALAAAGTRLADLEGRERATPAIAARERLLAARQALAEGRELHARGTPGYAEELQVAREALDAAEREIAAADAAARFRRAALVSLLALLALALAGTGFALNRRRRGVKQEAEQLLAGWRAALDKKLEALIDELEKRIARYVGPASGEGKRPFAGETLRLAGEIRADVGSLYILWTSAASVLEQAAALIRAGGAGALYNFFLPGKYRRGIALLRDEPVPFDPGDGLPKVFGYERTWRDDLLGDLASYEPFAKSFQEIVGELNLRAARAAGALDTVQSSLVEGPTALEETEELIRGTEARREEIERAAKEGGPFRLPALFSAVLPAAAAALERARAQFPTDPVAALAGEGATAHRIAVQAAELAGIAGEAARVAGLVATARADLGAALGLPADRILREEGADPSERLAGAGRQAGEAEAALGRGDVDAAAAALGEAARLTAAAEDLVEDSRRAFAAQTATVEERRAETARVAALLPEHERILAGVREAFAPSVLALGDGDPAHPEANGTLAAEEARAHVGFAREKLDRSGAAFLAGRLLGAARLLAEVRAHQELAVHRLQEIAERQARLARTVESNRDLLEVLEARVREGQVAVAGDPRTMGPTVTSFEQGRRQVEQARLAVEAAPGDPFRAEEELLAARAILDEVHDRLAPADRALHAEAGRSLGEANRHLASAGDLARRAYADGIPDSPEITRAYRALDALSAAQAPARDALGTPHGDWKVLDAEADRIAEEASRWAGTLGGEIAAAEAAAEALSRAARSVRQAGSWHGAYGIVIGGRPGAGALSRASTLLEQGRYQQVRQEAEGAYQEAIAAIAAAEAALRVREAEEERRREAEERRRDAERRRHHHGGGWGGGRSGGGGGGGSGSARSSWGGGSGSGSAKSGW